MLNVIEVLTNHINHSCTLGKGHYVQVTCALKKKEKKEGQGLVIRDLSQVIHFFGEATEKKGTENDICSRGISS